MLIAVDIIRSAIVKTALMHLSAMEHIGMQFKPIKVIW